MLKHFLIFLLFPFLVDSLELNILCTNDLNKNHSIDVKDIFVTVDTENNKVEIGGLSFYASEVNVTDTNISWFGENVSLYSDSNGTVSGIIGRFSGDLILDFIRYEDNQKSSLNFSCKRFRFKDRKF